MKTITTFIWTIAVIACISVLTSTASAQRQNRAQYLERLKTELALTDTQFVQVKEILDKAQEDLRAMRETFMGDREAMTEAFRQTNEESNTKINALLNDEQKEKFKVIQEEFRSRMRERRGNREN